MTRSVSGTPPAAIAACVYFVFMLSRLSIRCSCDGNEGRTRYDRPPLSASSRMTYARTPVWGADSVSPPIMRSIADASTSRSAAAISPYADASAR